MFKRILFLIAFLALPFCCIAEPYLAVREGLRCSSCHMNLTGGGKRTRMGTGFGAQNLPWHRLDLESLKIPHYWSVHDDLISIGGDLRVSNLTNFVEDNPTNTFQTEKSNLYLQLDLFPEFLTFYLDESVAPGGAQSREIFALIRKLPARGWIKAGKYVLPFGLGLEDDRAFVREITGFNFNTPDIGVELGFEPKHFTLVGSVTNGTAGTLDNNTAKQVIGTAGYIADAFRIGGSVSWNNGPDADRNVNGGWAGLKLGHAVLLGEADFIRDKAGGKTRNQIVTYSEINYRIEPGWFVRAGYEYYDPDTDIDENERDRVLIGLEPFITSFVHIQIQYRFNQSIPQNHLQNADDLTVRLHIYF